MTVGQAIAASRPLPVLTNSRMKNARGCLRYDKYRYVLRYKPARQTAALRFGSLMHAGSRSGGAVIGYRTRSASRQR